MSELGNWTVPLLSLLISACSLVVAVLTYLRVSRKYSSKTLHFEKEIMPEKEQTLFNIEGTGSLRRLEMTAKGRPYAMITLIVDDLVCMKESFDSLNGKGSPYITAFKLPNPYAEGEFSIEIDLQENFFKNLELMITNTNSGSLLLKARGTVHYDIHETRFHFPKRKSASS
jgi:hypothetical protein